MKIKGVLFSLIVILSAVLYLLSCTGKNITVHTGKTNLAVLAKATISSREGTWIMNELNDEQVPDSVPYEMRQWMKDLQQPGRSGHLTVQRFEYEWEKPVTIDEAAIFWYNFGSLLKLPQTYRFKYWNGKEYIPVENARGQGLINDQYNKTIFTEVTTNKFMVEVDSVKQFLPVILEWQVFKSKNSPAVAPVIEAGGDRDVMIGGKTYLSGKVKTVDPLIKSLWTAKGPGKVEFADPDAIVTTATFSTPGNYVLTLSSRTEKMMSSSSLKVKVCLPPQENRLDVVYTKRYKIDSPLWNARAKAMIVNWIPWCIDQITRTDLTLGEGGLDNFIEAGKALRGEMHGKHLGYVFSNAWVHQTIEAMCIALMIDPQGDKEIMNAQEKMKATLEKWIPVILAAQEPDGYLQTAYTLRDTTKWKTRWNPENRGNHEGYVAGYFLESAINHYTLTEGKDKRLYTAAKKLADCWVNNIGPGKKEWYDGHQEMEQALVRFGRFVNDMEGNGNGNSYINLAKFLLDCRKNGSEYDQSHVPVQQQYEAVGHAVRATYNYSAMADVAAETGDIDYQSAVMSLWDNMVNKKYYLTGGIGSGESSEGFGPNYSLPNDAYCESCSSCGLIFFQYKMNIAYNDAKYADLYEETMYNALLGSLDLDGKNFYYENALSSSQSRYSWHVCPCCIGNIPRTLLMIPTWTYVKSNKGIYVNLYIGSTIKVEKVAGTDVEMVQKTDYPWSGSIGITVNPKQPKEFTLFLRVPDRSTSDLYIASPIVKGLNSLAVNGKKINPNIVNGYAVIKRIWKAGDKVDLVLPMEIQTITADEKIEADRGRIALRYGPLVYNVERADQQNIDRYIGTGTLSLQWRKDMLGGIMAIKGNWDDGTQLIAIPNYARNNRNTVHATDKPGPGNKDGGSIVWIKKRL